MAGDIQQQRITDLEGLVDRLILDGALPERLTVEQKMDVLERLIEQWRIGRFRLKNELPMEEVLDLEWLVQSDQVFMRKPDTFRLYGKGTTQLQLQRRLIEHLLIDHGHTDSVLGVIDSFIERIHLELQPVDFKRTETGVIRCYTNTRFAATKLRDVGLLKFTNREAFKKWLLTLPGFVVAARSIQSTMPPLKECDKIGGIGLDKFIHDTRETIETYPQFVEALASLCAPNADIFRSFAPTLQRCHDHIRRYWDVLNDTSIKSADVIKRSGEFIDLIDQTEGYGPFIEEFSASIQLDRLIKEVNTQQRNIP